MRPINFPGANINFTAPRNWNDEKDGVCGDLPVCVNKEHGQFTSVWEPSAEERERIAKGENIALTCVGVQTPVRLDVALISEIKV